jgi:uncharacterized protein (DUF488 family)
MPQFFTIGYRQAKPDAVLDELKRTKANLLVDRRHRWHLNWRAWMSGIRLRILLVGNDLDQPQLAVRPMDARMTNWLRFF